MHLYVVAALALLFSLLAFGLVGPKSLRDRMRKFNTWYDKDAAVFFPIDPYKPLPEALREGGKNFWPTKERLRNWLRLQAIELGIVVVIFGIIILFLVIGSWISK